MNTLIVIIIIIILGYLLLYKNKETFTPLDTNKACLITKKMTSTGGEYQYEFINPHEKHEKGYVKLFTDDFTPEMCNSNYLGSGRHVGFECIDFMTEKEANKLGMIFSKKTCFDNLPYVADMPIYSHTA